MAKKVKCKDCENACGWSIPERISAANIDYAKYCLFLVSKTIVCERTMKTKGVEHEQYCKYFKKAEFDNCMTESQTNKLKKMIEDYETNLITE